MRITISEKYGKVFITSRRLAFSLVFIARTLMKGTTAKYIIITTNFDGGERIIVVEEP